MIELLLKALVALVVVAVVWYVALMLALPHPVPILAVLFVFLVAAIYLLRGRSSL